MLPLCVLAIVLLIPAATLSADPNVVWHSMGRMATRRCAFEAVYIGNGRILVMGGSKRTPDYNDPLADPLATCEILDVWNWRIEAAAAMRVPRAEFAAVRTRDSDVIAIGGVIGLDPHGKVTGLVERYDRAADRWDSVGMLLVPRRQHVAALLDEHRILVAGGRTADYATLTDVEIFDLRTGTSTRAEPFPYRINAATMLSSIEGELTVIGGRTGGINSDRREEVWSYSAAEDDWFPGGVLAQAVSGVAAIRLWDRRILVAGGISRESPIQTRNEVQLETDGRWRLMAQMSQSRAQFQIAQWSENLIIAIGGVGGNWDAMPTTEWINLSHYTTSPGPQMAVPRARFVALSVPARASAQPHEYAVVVIGGVAAGGAVSNSVEVLDPLGERPVRVPLGEPAQGRVAVADGALEVAFASDAPTTLRVRFVSVDGRELVLVDDEVIGAGAHRRVIPLPSLPSGWYMAEVLADGRSMRRVVIVGGR